MKIAKPSKVMPETENEDSSADASEDKSEFEQMFGYCCDPKEAMDIMMKAHVLKKDKEMMGKVSSLAESHKKPIKSIAALKRVIEEKSKA